MIQMKILSFQTGLLAAVVSLCLGSAHADTFDFSYVFGDGAAVTGSLEGTENGMFVENISNVSLFFGSDPIVGSVFTSAFDGVSYSSVPVVSFDALNNNFFFSNSDLAAGDFAFDSVFYISMNTAVAFSPTGSSQDDPVESVSWTLSRASVPDRGATGALLGLSVVIIGCMGRRFAITAQPTVR